ncbi:chloride channel protein [Rhizobium sp. BK251]|uniref:chloride channel protein n=1 Tax=Rhizobium sp. BK251 TaxID=2512125 RepID=UPI0010524E33|nr:chloride channel protein [Rhizobium sp. BK251]TCL75999.1 H+/Cl- antiporter ClcA [Rhizobium sp. BK251]
MFLPNRRSRLLRRASVFRASFDTWRPRLIFWLGALAIGVMSVAFAKLADITQLLFTRMTGAGEWTYLLPLVITPLGFVLSTYLAVTHFPNAQGSGIPQAMAARHLQSDKERLSLLSLKLAFGKILLTLIGLLSGASIGREGPTVQVGAAFMLAVARFGGMAQARGLILAGSAAGIAAAFNTPLAGVVFAIEEMSRSYESRANGLVLTTVILSGLAALAIAGDYNYFGVASAAPTRLADWGLMLICGIGGGALGAAFSGFSLYFMRRIRRWAQPHPLGRMVVVAGGCGLAVAIIGVLSGGDTFGTGYEVAKAAVEGSAPSVFFFIPKLLASFLSMISSIPGGIFAPALSVGAGFGSAVGTFMGSSIALAAILGMAGYFSGVVQAPMTAFVIILEMTGDHQAVLPIMAVSMIGFVTSRLLVREPLYHSLSRDFIASAIRARRHEARKKAPAENAG